MLLRVVLDKEPLNSCCFADCGVLLVIQVNDCHICGLPRAEVATALRDLPQRVRIVCARRKFSADDMMSLGSSTSTMQRLVKAKSEQSLASTSESASLSRNKSKSLEPLSKFGIWSSEPTEVLLIKADRGLGFSILDDPVSNHTYMHKKDLYSAKNQ